VNDTNGGAVLGFTLTSKGPKQVATVPAGSKPYGIAFDPTHNILFTTLTGRDQLLELTFRGTTVVRRRVQETVRQPNSVAVDPSTGQVVVTGSTPAGHLQLLQE
jgi:DNA-binding beta-propeller fold protein YncE